MAGTGDLGKARCTCFMGIAIPNKNDGFMCRYGIQQGEHQTPNHCVGFRAYWGELYIKYMQEHATLQSQMHVDCELLSNYLQHMCVSRV